MFIDDDTQFYPAGRHVPQTSGDPSQGLTQWIEQNPKEKVADVDIVVW